MQPAEYEPSPFDTSSVQLSPELEELVARLAANAHEIWAQQRVRDGWSYGPQRDDAHKKHPSLVPYDRLDDSERRYDIEMVRGALRGILALGYRIERC